MVYVLACYGNSWLDKLIQGVQGNKITHIAIQITDDIIVEASYLGVKLSPIAIKNGQFIKLRFNTIDEDTQHKLFICVLDMVGKVRYDYTLFFGFGVNKALSLFDIFGVHWRVNFDDPTKMICAEVIVEAFKKITGVDLLPSMVDSEIAPQHILLSPYLEPVT